MAPPLRAAGEFGIGYRAMTEGDLPFVAALYASTRAAEVAQAGWPAAVETAFLRQQHEAQHHHYRATFADAEWLIVEREGEPIGRLYLHRNCARLAIVDISLVPPACGGGIGSAILRDILSLGADSRLPVVIHVEMHNPARRLYERLGFRVVERVGAHDRMQADPPAMAAS